MAKKLVVCMDGTWNTAEVDPGGGEEPTNVYKLHQLLAAQDAHGHAQLSRYINGVGTDWCDRLLGGVFGVGLSRRIQDGYRFLVQHYQPGDEIFVFGFSRGAYSARSLVGLIRKSGLLNMATFKARQLDALVGSAYSLYRIKNDSVDSPAAQDFRAQYSHTTPKIKCLGVWDTVGSLGIPIQSFNFFVREYYEFHDTELSAIVENAFHAVAVDEWREDYAATLWRPKSKPNQRVEQVWFPGAHANVGGGYKGNQLSLMPLQWMLAQASDCGLAFKRSKALEAALALSPHHIVNSYGRFLGGAYQQLKSPHFRPIGETAFGNEAIHPIVQTFLARDDYRPKNQVGDFVVGEFCPKGKLRL